MALVPVLADKPSHEGKVRVVFEDFDVNRSRFVECDHFASSFRRLQVDFSTATVTDLFSKADANNDGVVSYPEWQRFSELYPTLIDCLYYRVKDIRSDKAQKEAIESGKTALDHLREKEAAAQAAYQQARSDTAAAENRLQSQMQRVAEAQSEGQLAQANLENAHEATDKARGDLQKRGLELNTAKDREREAANLANEAQRAVEAAQRRLRSQGMQVASAEERLRELERIMAEQQRLLDEQRAAADKCQTELESCEATAQNARAAAAAALQDVHEAADRVAEAEKEVAHRQAKEKEAAQKAREAQAAISRESVQKDADQRSLVQARDCERMREGELHAASCAVDGQERTVADMEAENHAFLRKRQMVNDEEQPLLEQEVMLREQRACLETKEAKLANDFTHFTGRSPSRSSPRKVLTSPAAVRGGSPRVGVSPPLPYSSPFLPPSLDGYSSPAKQRASISPARAYP